MARKWFGSRNAARNAWAVGAGLSTAAIKISRKKWVSRETSVKPPTVRMRRIIPRPGIGLECSAPARGSLGIFSFAAALPLALFPSLVMQGYRMRLGASRSRLPLPGGERDGVRGIRPSLDIADPDPLTRSSPKGEDRPLPNGERRKPARLSRAISQPHFTQVG